MPKQSKKQPWWQLARKHALIYIGLVGVVGIMGTALVYKPLMVAREKDNFLKAQEGLEQLYSEIVATVGEPDQNKRENECSYASGKFEDGPLSCKVAIYLLYENRDAVASTDIMLSTSKVTGSSKLTANSSRQKTETFLPENNYAGQIFYQHYPNINVSGISCSVNYKFSSDNFLDGRFITTSTSHIQVTLSCSGSARAEHF